VNESIKKIVSGVALFCLGWWQADAQIIPDNRRVDWQQAVQSFSYKEPSEVVSIAEFGGLGDGIADNTEALNKAMDSFHGRAGAVFFPGGTYLFVSPVFLNDSIELQGSGSMATILKFDLGRQPKNCISITGKAENHFVRLKGGYVFKSSRILSDSAFYFKPGDWVEIIENNGSWNSVPASWAKHSVGQITRIKYISGDTIALAQPLRITYSDSLVPRLQRIFPAKNVSLSCFKVHRADTPPDGGGDNIFFDYAVNSRVTGIESDTSAGSHVYINRSAQIIVEESYFHHSFSYDGSSTHGYGVTVAHHSSGCLIENNIFSHLRHAMMAKTGANGNVFAYNYSRDPYRSEAMSDLTGDISLHGHYAYANLFEGNIVQNIIIDHYWGPSGPRNTFFRNRAELWGIIMTQRDANETSGQNFVGNECTDGSFYHGQFTLTGNNHFVYANNILGQIVPDTSGNLPDSSYYLKEKPSFWLPGEQWPDIGYPNSLGQGNIPARQQFNAGGIFNSCRGDKTAVRDYWEKGFSWKIGPNPVTNNLHIASSADDSVPYFAVRIFDLEGNLLYESLCRDKKAVIPFRSILVAGTYLLEISSKKFYFRKKIIMAE
jgi:hypothetical protein